MASHRSGPAAAAAAPPGPALPSLTVTIPTMLGHADRPQYASAPINVAAFRDSFAAALGRYAQDAFFHDAPDCPADEWAKAEAACRVDDIVEDAASHFSGPLLQAIMSLREAGATGSPTSKRRRKSEPTATDAADASTPAAAQPPANEEESGTTGLVAQLRQRLQSSHLTTLRNVQIIANLVERTKPRKQVNHLSLLRKGAAGDHSGAEDHGGDTLRRVTRADKGDSRVPRTPLAPTEVVLSVALYYPHRPGVKLREFLVLGSQTLAELRDCLHCPTDRLLDGPTRHSGYFLIEKVFYNDMRRPENLDYSAPVLEWAADPERQRNNPHLTGFSAAKMEDTRWEDLTVRTATPYVYCHQGNCEHVLMITAIRLLHPSDEQDRAAYPLLTFQARTRRPKCRVCETYPSKYVAYGDRLANENPMFYCPNCYDMLHYDATGQLLYDDFTVYDYDPA